MRMWILGAALISTAAVADTVDYSKKFGIGGSLGYNAPIFGHTFNTAADGGETWGFHGRYHFNAANGLELAFTKHEFADVMNALQVTDLTYFRRLNPTARFSPILGLGAGIVDITHYEPESNWKLGLKARAGAEYALTKCLSLGLNVDYQHVNKMFFGDNLDGRNIHVLAGRVGVTWYFGSTMAAAAAATTAAVAKVMDKDSDNDGVVDSKDKCPSTAEGVSVNAYGCAKEEKATVHMDVKFATGKAVVDQNFDGSIKDMAEFMAANPNTKLEVQGHTDSSGSKAINKKLSQARAEAVKAYLVNNLKVNASRVTAKGYGDEMPVADNATAEGRTANRRVVGVITE